MDNPIILFAMQATVACSWFTACVAIESLKPFKDSRLESSRRQLIKAGKNTDTNIFDQLSSAAQIS